MSDDDYAWAYERVVDMAANAYIDARVYGVKLLKGFGYPNEVMSRAQDARALEIVLQRLPKPEDCRETVAPLMVQADLEHRAQAIQGANSHGSNCDQ